MAVTAYWYGYGMAKALAKEVSWTAGGIKAALCTSSYTPAQDTHDYFNDITNEVTGDGYTAGGAALAAPTLTYTGATNVLKLDADDVSWAASTITARYAIIYDATTGVAATSPLLLYVDFGQDYTTTGATFTITWSASGIATLTVS